jgi:hypothetical protein
MPFLDTNVLKWMQKRGLDDATPLLIALSTPALAIDRNGNYTVHDFFPTKDEYALSTWKVVAAHLNCRKQPENTDKILRVFHQGSASELH